MLKKSGMDLADAGVLSLIIIHFVLMKLKVSKMAGWNKLYANLISSSIVTFAYAMDGNTWDSWVPGFFIFLFIGRLLHGRIIEKKTNK